MCGDSSLKICFQQKKHSKNLSGSCEVRGAPRGRARGGGEDLRAGARPPGRRARTFHGNYAKLLKHLEDFWSELYRNLRITQIHLP